MSGGGLTKQHRQNVVVPCPRSPVSSSSAISFWPIWCRCKVRSRRCFRPRLPVSHQTRGERSRRLPQFPRRNHRNAKRGQLRSGTGWSSSRLSPTAVIRVGRKTPPELAQTKGPSSLTPWSSSAFRGVEPLDPGYNDLLLAWELPMTAGPARPRFHDLVTLARAAAEDRHAECVEDELGAHVVGDRPAEDSA